VRRGSRAGGEMQPKYLFVEVVVHLEKRKGLIRAMSRTQPQAHAVPRRRRATPAAPFLFVFGLLC
jgi:hypothetical protein